MSRVHAGEWERSPPTVAGCCYDVGSKSCREKRPGHADPQAIRGSHPPRLRVDGSRSGHLDRRLDGTVWSRRERGVPVCRTRGPGMPVDRITRGMRRVHAGFLPALLSCVREQPRLLALVCMCDGLPGRCLRGGLLRETSRRPHGSFRVPGARGLLGSAMLCGLPVNCGLLAIQGRMSTGVPPLLT
jgi:hypothetical protein